MTPLAPARPYRDFLTPALHKRFTDASFYTIVLCYLISVWMGDLDNYLWSWFPIGPVGIRTLLLFVPTLVVFVLRVAQWHVGHRNTQTPWETFSKYTLRKNTFVTIGGYVLSAWFYSEVYIWTRSKHARLGLTDYQGKAYERIRLNERPLFLRFMFFALAVIQGGVHLWRDYDNIEIQAMKPRNERDAAALALYVHPRQALIQKLKPMAITAAFLSISTGVVGTIIYFLGLRNVLWEYYYNVAKRLISLGKTSKPFGLPPFFPLLMMFLIEGSLLVLLWQFVNKAFDVYISQAPLKKDQPITNDSKDPNGSLLNGLKSKKETLRAIALWELALITDGFPERRKTIYGELERKKAATFKQVTDICLAEVHVLSSRISVALDPKFLPEVEASKQKPAAPIALVPQVAQPLKDAPIRGSGQVPETRMEKFGAFTADIAKATSSPQNSQTAYAREYLKKGHDKFAQGAKEVESASSTYFSHLVASPFGFPFRHSLRRSAALIITGAPYSHISLICNAVTALTNLTVFSLREDDCGQFQTVVPEIIRAFTAAIRKVDEYVGSLTPHWSDLEAKGRPETEWRKGLVEVETVRDCLREGLERILRAFGEYLVAMRLTGSEIRDAKKGAARGPEMAVAR